MISRVDTGLILIDMQGKLARVVDGSERLIANSSNLVRAASILGLPLIWLEQTPEKLGITVPEIAGLLTEKKPLTKSTFNACDTAHIKEAILKENVSTWLICGIEAHICVYQTALGVKELGKNVEVIGDAVGSRTVENKERALQKLIQNGIGITTVEMCLYELIKDAQSEHFKSILSLIK
ncbi:MAG: isochorismatase family protein [Chloroherpetonaceae bacterium]|nr:isochorismatase family protein [Chloroherpetonaceae bacterium]